MDIVDKVFENLNLGYDADKEREKAARARQKESLARRKVRLGVLGGVATVVVAGVGLALWLPQSSQSTVAGSDIAVVFNEDEQPIAEVIVRKVAEATEDTADEATDTATEETAESVSEPASTETASVVNAARSAVARKANSTVKTQTVTTPSTETIVHVIDSGEQVDQGVNDDCRAIPTGSTGIVLWCNNSAAAATEDDEADEPQESEDEVETED